MIRKAFVVSDFVTLAKCFLFLVFVFWLLADCGPMYFAVHGTLEFHGNPRLAPLFFLCSLFHGLKPMAIVVKPLGFSRVLRAANWKDQPVGLNYISRRCNLRMQSRTNRRTLKGFNRECDRNLSYYWCSNWPMKIVVHEHSAFHGCFAACTAIFWWYRKPRVQTRGYYNDTPRG